MARLELNVEGEITERDFLRAQWLHMKPRRGYRIAGCVVIALFAVTCVVLIFVSTSLGDPAPAATFLGPIAGILLGGALLRWQFRRIYRRQPSLHGTHSYQFTDAGFVAISPLGRGEATWGVFTKWREDANLFLLYQADNLFHMLPKRWFGHATGLEDFRSLIERQSIPRVD